MTINALSPVSSSFTDHFQMVSFAGEGGTKVVWCVKKVATGVLKAFAQYRLFTDIVEEQDESETEKEEKEEKEERVRISEKTVLEKAKHEVDIFQRLSGVEHVMPLEDFGCEENRPWLIMPYYARGDLSSAISKRSLTLDQKCQIALDLLHGLQQCQSRGVVIGDIKLANVLLDNDFRAVFSDFETAQITDDSEAFKYDTYNLCHDVLGLLFDSNDGKFYEFMNDFLSNYNCDTCPSIATILNKWKSLSEHRDIKLLEFIKKIFNVKFTS